MQEQVNLAEVKLVDHIVQMEIDILNSEPRDQLQEGRRISVWPDGYPAELGCG